MVRSFCQKELCCTDIVGIVNGRIVSVSENSPDLPNADKMLVFPCSSTWVPYCYGGGVDQPDPRGPPGEEEVAGFDSSEHMVPDASAHIRISQSTHAVIVAHDPGTLYSRGPAIGSELFGNLKRLTGPVTQARVKTIAFRPWPPSRRPDSRTWRDPSDYPSARPGSRQRHRPGDLSGQPRPTGGRSLRSPLRSLEVEVCGGRIPRLQTGKTDTNSGRDQ